MKDQIGELIKGYHQQIENCDNMLVMLKKQIRTSRHEGTSSEMARLEKRHFNAQRQCYIQTISDLEDILD